MIDDLQLWILLVREPELRQITKALAQVPF